MSELPPELALESELPPEIDTSRPHPARMYDYYLGGKNHFAADRKAADKCDRQRPVGAHRAAGEPGVPRPRRQVPGGGGGHQAVPRHRHRAADHEQRARGRAGGDTVIAGWSTRTTTRWCSRTRGPCSPPRPRAVPRTSRPTCATRGDPVQPGRPRGTRLQPAGRADARRGPALHPGRGQARGDHRHAARRAAVWQLPRRLARDGGTRPAMTARRQRAYREAGLPVQARDSDEFARLAFSGLELVPPGVVLVVGVAAGRHGTAGRRRTRSTATAGSPASRDRAAPPGPPDGAA